MSPQPHTLIFHVDYDDGDEENYTLLDVLKLLKEKPVPQEVTITREPVPPAPPTQLALFDSHGQARDGQLHLVTALVRAPGIIQPQAHLVQTPFRSVYLKGGPRVNRSIRPGGPLHLNQPVEAAGTRRGPPPFLPRDL